MTAQVRVHGPGDVRLDEVTAPVAGERDAVVRVAACGLCGSDRAYVAMGGVAGGVLPMPLGHELAGVVDAVGGQVRGFRAGDRVVVRPGDDDLGRIGNGIGEGGLTTHVLVREADRRLYAVPDALDLQVAAIAEPLGVGMRAVEQAAATPSDRVVVFGCGAVGLGAIASLVDGGNREVVAVDPSRRRRELALELGAHGALDPSDGDLWEGIAGLHGTVPSIVGPTLATDAYVEASGASSLLPEVLLRARAGARVSVVALHFSPVALNLLPLTVKELTIRGSLEYPARFETTIELLARRDLSSMITHRFPLHDVAAALDVSAAADCGKVLVVP